MLRPLALQHIPPHPPFRGGGGFLQEERRSIPAARAGVSPRPCTFGPRAAPPSPAAPVPGWKGRRHYAMLVLHLGLGQAAALVEMSMFSANACGLYRAGYGEYAMRIRVVTVTIMSDSSGNALGRLSAATPFCLCRVTSKTADPAPSLSLQAATQAHYACSWSHTQRAIAMSDRLTSTASSTKNTEI